MNIIADLQSTSFSPTLCVTHNCNLSCIYCYQKNKDHSKMSFDTAKSCIDDIFFNIPQNTSLIEISFIGGEPLLEIDLIKDIYEYTLHSYPDSRIQFFATTNGTTLTASDKEWFYNHREKFILGLSLDGTRETHNYNRSNSFDLIDISYFVKTWPLQGPKLTISRKTIHNFANDIIFIHQQGFKTIYGVNFAEGDFDWGDKSELDVLAKQLHLLVDFYTKNYKLNLNQMFGKRIELCASQTKNHNKTCGVGSRTVFYDVDGYKYPCSFITPMTFDKVRLKDIEKVDFTNPELFTDFDCYENCYLYPICTSCSGANFLVNKAFNKRIKTRCNMIKLISLFIAELHTRRILLHRDFYTDQNQLFYLIEAIKGIRNNYYEEYKGFLRNR